MSEKKYKKYIDYLQNIGRPCKTAEFYEDWKPIGEIILNEMSYLGLVDIDMIDKYIYLRRSHDTQDG